MCSNAFGRTSSATPAAIEHVFGTGQVWLLIGVNEADVTSKTGTLGDQVGAGAGGGVGGCGDGEILRAGSVPLVMPEKTDLVGARTLWDAANLSRCHLADCASAERCSMSRRPFALPVAVAITTVSMLLTALPAHAGLVDIWTTYAGISACKTDLLNLNDFCYGLRDGQAIGLVDANVAVDELDQGLGVYYDDENVLPAPESATNPVVEVWNNTADYTFIAAGTSLAADEASGDTIYYIAPGADATGPAVDADGANITYAPMMCERSMGTVVPCGVVSWGIGEPRPPFSYS
jgi:hypothetical protein